jgi:preprotein translocase subunit SecB
MTRISGLRAKAARVADCAEFRDVRLLSLEGGLVRSPSSEGALVYNLDIDVTAQYAEGDPVLVVHGDYDLLVTERTESDDEESEELARLKFNFAALFTLKDKEGEIPESFDENELNAFAESSGTMALYPFAREFIHDVTGRFALPPLTIGMLKFPVEKEELVLEQ